MLVPGRRVVLGVPAEGPDALHAAGVAKRVHQAGVMAGERCAGQDGCVDRRRLCWRVLAPPTAARVNLQGPRAVLVLEESHSHLAVRVIEAGPEAVLGI